MKFVDFSVRSNRSKHPNQRTMTGLSTDERICHKLFLLIAKKTRHSRHWIKWPTSSLAYICFTFIAFQMLVCCNTKQFLNSNVFKSDYMIGKYLILVRFSEAHECTFKKIKVGLSPFKLSWFYLLQWKLPKDDKCF